jgi:hydrogenase nickel incorporation protein HypA/HybF
MDANAMTQRLIEKAIGLADGQAITELHVLLGELTGVRPQEVQATFRQARAQTLADAATLHIRTEPGRGVCLTCGQASPLVTKDDACPACGSRRVHLVAGHLLHLASLTFHGHGRNNQAPGRPTSAKAPVRVPAQGEVARTVGQKRASGQRRR